MRERQQVAQPLELMAVVVLDRFTQPFVQLFAMDRVELVLVVEIAERLGSRWARPVGGMNVSR